MTRRNPFRNVLIISVTLAVVGCERSTQTETAAPVLEAPVAGIPTFRVDPDWPQVPAQWKLGDVSSIAIDAQDNAWLLHRPRVLPPDEADMAAPAVLGFDSDGNFLDAWGGAAEDYEWSSYREHVGQPDLERGFELSDLPIELPAGWKRLVHRDMAERERDAIVNAIKRGAPLGDQNWIEKTVKTLGLQATINKRGRPKKET